MEEQEKLIIADYFKRNNYEDVEFISVSQKKQNNYILAEIIFSTSGVPESDLREHDEGTYLLRLNSHILGCHYSINIFKN